MRLPRWLLIPLIVTSCVLALGIPIWLWIDTPRRMASRLLAAIESGDCEEANKLVTDATFLSEPKPQVLGNHTINVQRLKLVLAPRELHDLLDGHQRLVVHMRHNDAEWGVTCVASWNGITTDWSVLDETIALALQSRANAMRGKYRTPPRLPTPWWLTNGRQ